MKGRCCVHLRCIKRGHCSTRNSFKYLECESTELHIISWRILTRASMPRCCARAALPLLFRSFSFLFSFLFFFFFYIYLVYFIFYCIRTLSTRIIVLRVLFFSLLCYIFSLELFLSLLSLSTPLFFNYYHYYYYRLIFIRITHFSLFFFLGGYSPKFYLSFLSSLFSLT